MAIVVSGIVSRAPALADAPKGRYTIAVDSVRDEKTSLLWKRAVTLGDGGNVPSLEEANKLCALPWRLPTIKEAATLVDESASAPPFIDGTAFPATPNLPLWTSTKSNALMEDYRSYVLNGDGTMVTVYYNGGDLPGGGMVRCVQ
jgi:hypothetical protein